MLQDERKSVRVCYKITIAQEIQDVQIFEDLKLANCCCCWQTYIKIYNDIVSIRYFRISGISYVQKGLTLFEVNAVVSKLFLPIALNGYSLCNYKLWK